MNYENNARPGIISGWDGIKSDVIAYYALIIAPLGKRENELVAYDYSPFYGMSKSSYNHGDLFITQKHLKERVNDD